MHEDDPEIEILRNDNKQMPTGFVIFKNNTIADVAIFTFIETVNKQIF